MRRFSGLLGLLVTAVVLPMPHPVSAQDWESQTSGTTNPLNGVFFLDEARGFVVGDAGTLLETEDGGLTWTPEVLTTDDLLAVTFLDDSLGLIVGDNGRIFRTTDAGNNWVNVTSPTVNNLAGVAFGADGLAYAAGRDGTILSSADNGANWTLVETGADRYRSIAAFGRRAWAVGNDGVMRATRDGGATWFSPMSTTASDLHDVVFVSASEGWVVGQNNTVLYTDDGGESWASRSGTIGVGLNAVFFGNSELGWVGGTGDAFHSTDGGLIWTSVLTPTLEELNDLHFADVFHGWAAGENGTILTRVVLSTTLSMDRDRIEWDPVPGDVAYDVVRGDLQTLRSTGGDYGAATVQCVENETGATSVDFFDSPSAGVGIWLLVRVNEGDPGIYDSGSFRQTGVRDPSIASSGMGCP